MSNSIILRPHVLGSVEKSNLPAEHKSDIRTWYERMMAKKDSAKSTAVSIAEEAGMVARGNIVGGIVGVALAELEQHYGTLDFGKRKDIPADALVAGASAIAAFLTAGKVGSIEARHASIAATSVYGYRSRKEHNEKKQSGGTVNGEDSALLKDLKNAL